jgi:pSer/pThr/pTyr-binding forkhead associated (FHA) protein
MSSEHSTNSFMIACGLAGPLELEVENTRTGLIERRVYHQPYAQIGRTTAADLPLDDEQVSRRHAYLQAIAGRVYCVDLASRTGLRWGDGSYGSGWLAPGRRLDLGAYAVRLGGSVTPEPTRAEPTRPGGSPRRLPRVLLEFPGDPAAQPPWRLNRMLTLVGRAALCRVLLGGADVSRFHCSLVRTPMGVWVVDLLGRAGTTVDGRPVRSRLLGDGDVLGVGSHRIVVRYERPARPAASGRPAAGLAALPSLTPSAAMPVLPSLTPPVAAPWSAEGAALEVRTLLAGRSPEQVELAESLLVPMVHQMGQMQTQMLDQFQQMMMMMFQMFTSMHRDQMQVVHEEMAQIRRLTEELQSAQTLLREQVESRREPAPAPPSPRPNGPPRIRLASPRPEPTGSSPRPEPPPTAATRRSEARPPEPPRRAAAAEDPEAATHQLHALLAQRIAALQQERQTRWQRLMQMFGGSGGGKTPPDAGS